MKKTTITIGIPAYNEEKNIKGLIKDLLKQRVNKFTVDKIIIVSDGSTDNTVSIAKQFKNNKIEVYEATRRMGKANRENELINMSSSDILVLLDADIVINDTKFLEKLIKPIVQGLAEMTSSVIVPSISRTFFEQILVVSTKLKEKLFSEFKDGNNAYTCYGPARAFARKLYKKLHFITNEGEDMFSYFSCITQGYSFQNVTNAITYYRLPSTLNDHFRQSIRYHRVKVHLNRCFDQKTILSELIIPFPVYIKAAFRALSIFARYPVHVFFYVVILTGAKFLTLINFKHKENWNVKSSKLVRSNL